MEESEICQSCGKPVGAKAVGGLCPECLMKAGMQSTDSNFNSSSSSTRADPRRFTRFIPPDPETLRPHFPQLDIVKLIGKGGMGAVYQARQRELDRWVALKILPPEVGSDPAFTRRFTSEARTLARISHANIVTVHDFGQAGGFYYFMMEYVDGLNLRQAMAAHRLAPEEAVAVVPQICDALQYAHDQGIVHRDIKPENILIDKSGKVKIADFGLAKMLRADPQGFRMTAEHDIMGTPHYMAPEQWETPLAVDHRADIYSLGVVFYEMLTGELPLGRFPRPSQKVQVDVRLDEVVLRALAKDPTRRYQQAGLVKTELDTISRSPRTPPGKIDRERALRRVQLPGLGLMVFGLVGAIGKLAAWFLWGPAVTSPSWLYIRSFLWSRVVVAPSNREFALLSPQIVMAVYGVIFLAGLRMRRLLTYSLAMAGTGLALAATLPALLPLGFFLRVQYETTLGPVAYLPGWILPVIPVWALIVLQRREVRAAFETSPKTPRSTSRRRLHSPRISGAPRKIILAAGLAVLLTAAGWKIGHRLGWWSNKTADRSTLYEKAEASGADLAVLVGPNRFTVNAVVRRGAGGTWQVEDGRGNALLETDLGIPPEGVDPVAWLDVAEVHFGASSPVLAATNSPYEIIEIRVLEPGTGELLAPRQKRWGAGWELLGPGRLQVRSAGAALPSQLDIWFRASSHTNNLGILSLPLKVGATVKPEQSGMPMKITVQEVRDGHWSYRQTRSHVNWSVSPASPAGCTVVLHCEGKWNLGRYQICAVDATAPWKRDFPGTPHFVDFRRLGATQVIQFKWPRHRIDHLELRPFGGRHTFYFSGVQLPPLSTDPTVEPPPMKFQIEGHPGLWESNRLAPVRAQLISVAGSARKISSDILQPGLDFPARTNLLGVSSPSTESLSSFAAWIEGLAVTSPQFTFHDAEGREIETSPRRSQSVFGPADACYAASVPIPLQRIESVTLHLGRPPHSDL